MNEDEYRDILRHLQRGARELGITDIDVQSTAPADGEQNLPSREQLLLSLEALRTQALLGSTRVANATTAKIREALGRDSETFAGFDIILDEKDQRRFDAPSIIGLSGSVAMTEVATQIELLILEIQEVGNDRYNGLY